MGSLNVSAILNDTKTGLSVEATYLDQLLTGFRGIHRPGDCRLVIGEVHDPEATEIAITPDVPLLRHCALTVAIVDQYRPTGLTDAIGVHEVAAIHQPLVEGTRIGVRLRLALR